MQNVIDLPGVRPAPANDFSAVSRPAARPVQQPGSTPVEPQPLLPQEAGHGLTKDIIPLVKPDIELPDNTEALADKTHGVADKDAHRSWQALISSRDTIEKALAKGNFETELALLLTQIKSDMKEIKVSQIRQAREENTQKIAENREQLKEAETRFEEAERSRTANKIFGWLSSAVSAIAGTVLLATGVGALAGAMMIASAVTSVASQIVNEAAEAGLIDDETMKYLGPAMTGLQVVAGIATCAVTFGGGAAGVIAQEGARAGSTLVQTGLSVSGSVLDAGAVISGTTAAVLSGLGNKQIAGSQETKGQMMLLQQAMTKLQNEFSKMISQHQDAMSALSRFSQEKAEVAGRIAAAHAAK
ncbi:TPA: type III secretion system translocon subunit SctE [Morganella morganii]|nr:type III secretion system translocon subunit SctE [Morganella morganii]